MIRPDFLQPSDNVGILAPASKVAYDALYEGIEILKEDWKLNIIEGQTLRTDYHQFSAHDELRLHDLQMMLDDKRIKTIFAARGGYGTSRLVDLLNFRRFRKSPKWIVGFSDITALHCHLSNLGYESIHGVMPKLFAQTGGVEALESLRKALFGEPLSYQIPPHILNREGVAEGEIIGGNLCLLAHLIGSRSEIDTRGKILFIEDVEEYLYNLDRMMVQLKRAKKLEKLAGLVVGQFTDLKDNKVTAFGKTAYQIIAEHTASYHYPICYDFPVGHVPDNRAMIVGRNATLKVTQQQVTLIYSH